MSNQSDKQPAGYPPCYAPPPAPVNAAQAPSIEVMGPAPDLQDSADIRDYIEIVLRRKWLVCSVIFAAFLTTLIVSFTMRPLYKATGKIEVNPQAPKVTKFDELAMLGSQVQTREFMQTQLKLLQSESLAGRVIDKLGLENNPVFNPAFSAPVKDDEDGIISRFKGFIKDVINSWVDILRLKENEPQPDPNLPSLKLRNGVVKKFAKNLQVQVERDTTLISLSFVSPDPTVSREIIDALIQEFISWQVDKKIDSSVTAKKQLEKQIEIARIQLEKAENNLNEFARKAGIVSLSTNLNLIYSQLEEANKAFAAVQTERMHKEALYDQAKQGAAAFPAIVENTMIQKLHQDHGAAAAEYKESSVTFKDDYPKLQNLKAKMLDIERQIKYEENRILESLKADYLTAVKREEVLKQDTEDKKALAMNLNDRATQYKILEREVDTNKLIHTSLFERSRELDARVGTELGNIQVVDYASQPLGPYTPNIPMNLTFSLIFGIVAGIGLAFLLEYLDNTVKRIDEISDRFRVPVLGVLPMVHIDELPGISSIVRAKPTAGFSEAIRTAKVSIQLSSSLDQRPKVLLMTSTTPGEGKSTVSANLGLTFAPEEKVLMMDADLRKPTLHKFFPTDDVRNGKRKGLSNYLTGSCSLDEIIRTTAIPNIDIITAGPIPPNPSELLASGRMRQLIEQIETEYDRIIIDGPPSTGFADALILGHYANGVILVSTLGQTHREALRIFRKSLMNVGGRLIGSIVNKLNVTNRYGGYYYKYYRYYKHYSYQPAYRQDNPPDLPSLPDESQ